MEFFKKVRLFQQLKYRKQKNLNNPLIKLIYIYGLYQIFKWKKTLKVRQKNYKKSTSVGESVTNEQTQIRVGGRKTIKIQIFKMGV